MDNPQSISPRPLEYTLSWPLRIGKYLFYLVIILKLIELGLEYQYHFNNVGGTDGAKELYRIKAMYVSGIFFLGTSLTLIIFGLWQLIINNRFTLRKRFSFIFIVIILVLFLLGGKSPNNFIKGLPNNELVPLSSNPSTKIKTAIGSGNSIFNKEIESGVQIGRPFRSRKWFSRNKEAKLKFGDSSWSIFRI